MYRKILLIFITIIEGMSLMAKSFLFTFVMLVSLIMFASFNPYQNKKINTLERESMAITLLISYLGCVYASNIGDFWQTLLFIIVVIINTLFFLRWIKGFAKLNLWIHHGKVSKKLPSLFHKLIPCFILFNQIRKKIIRLKNIRYHFIVNQKNFKNYYEEQKDLKVTILICEKLVGVHKKKKISFTNLRSNLTI